MASNTVARELPLCTCPVGHFDNGTDDCEECDYKCGSCSISSEKCMTCSDENRDINNGC